MHYQKTGKHKQVSLRYNPENRTEFEFSSWKHERDHHSVRAILPEDIIISGDGNNVVASGDLSAVILNTELDDDHTFINYDEDNLIP